MSLTAVENRHATPMGLDSFYDGRFYKHFTTTWLS